MLDVLREMLGYRKVLNSGIHQETNTRHITNTHTNTILSTLNYAKVLYSLIADNSMTPYSLADFLYYWGFLV